MGTKNYVINSFSGRYFLFMMYYFDYKVVVKDFRKDAVLKGRTKQVDELSSSQIPEEDVVLPTIGFQG